MIEASFVRLGPAVPVRPLVITVPHAGRDYPPALLAAARLSRDRLEALEDRHADRLVEPLADGAATIFVARRARAWIDLNRDPHDLDPAMVAPAPARIRPPSRRVRGGLGLIPRRIAGAGDIYARPLPLADVARRIAADHAPWHDAVAAALATARARFGIAVLIECHSMPPLPGAGMPTIVVGDRHGTSADAGIVAAAIAAAVGLGHHVARNVPYAGGYALERHGDPRRGVHAVQVEFCRSLYLDAAARDVGPGLDRTQAAFGAIVDAVQGAILPDRLAAE